ncbi:hypothetical protein B0A49_13907, partial [Cryomyces minteri]
PRHHHRLQSRLPRQRPLRLWYRRCSAFRRILECADGYWNSGARIHQLRLVGSRQVTYIGRI